MTNKVDNKLRYSAIIDNRSVVAAICINELEFLITQTDFVQDRQMLQSMICGCNRQIDTDNPLKLLLILKLNIMLIDFRNITIKNIEGEESTVDISKDLGNLLYNSAVSQEGLEISRELYHNGEMDVTKENVEVLKGIIAGNFLAVIQESLNPIFDKIMNTEEIETSAEEIKDEQTTC